MSAYKGGYCPANVYLRGAGEYTEIDGVRQMVQKPCKVLNNGTWFCEACNVKTTMDGTMWEHTLKVGAHVIVWLCRYHGAEQAPGGE